MINILPESPELEKPIEDLLLTTFKGLPYSDQGEADLVKRIRADKDVYNKNLALCLEKDGELIGYSIACPIHLESDSKTKAQGLILALIAILPKHQQKNFGTQLMIKMEEIATALGYEFIAVIGQPEFFAPLGFDKVKDHGLSFHFDLPEEYARVKALGNHNLKNTKGLIVYPEPFF